jgi:CubicO group peptidase (beta-lactamase class C family)
MKNIRPSNPVRKQRACENRRLAPVLLALMLSALGAAQAWSQKSAVKAATSVDLPLAKPESAGFSSQRLERLHALMQRVTADKSIPGAVTILARHGKVIDYRAYGLRDVESGTPMTKDTIFRDFSMSKPITGVAMMILFEQGKWLPSDPISKYIPEFAHLRVFKGVDADGKIILEDPIHPPTMHELMTHTAGFTYGYFGNTPVDKLYLSEKVLESKSLEDMIDKLAKIPLLYQPGTKWVYSVSMDIQGYIIEKLSGQSLPDFMRENIFQPLGMKDTGFYVPAGKRSRFATLYRTGPKGELITEPAQGGFGGDFAEPPAMPSGGGGLVSTAADYYRFAQMLGNGGQLNGVRILSPASVKLMGSNHLAPNLLTGEFGIGWQRMRPGFGYGYDCAVEYNPPEADLPGGAGTFFWDGYAGTWYWVDPANDIVFVGMIQRALGFGSPNVQYLSRSTVYQAFVNPKM